MHSTETAVAAAAGETATSQLVSDDPANRPSPDIPGWFRLHLTLDLGLVAALTAFVLLTLPLIDGGAEGPRPPDAGAVVLVCIAGLATALRHRGPLRSLVVVSIAVGGYLFAGYPYGPVFGFVALTVYLVARRRPMLPGAAAALASFAALVAHVAMREPESIALGLLSAITWVAIPYTVGTARRLVDEARGRERAAADRRLVDAERLRLSQEVHDVVGHGLAAIQLQADVALHAGEARPELARTALRTISRASAEALDDLRSTLASLRTDAEAGSPIPLPGLARAEELCQRVQDAGVGVTLIVSGRVRPLQEAADVAAYRVLQEALTNVVKHSAHPHAEVRIDHALRNVAVTVRNTDLGPAAVEGIGITGMRRRVDQVGGIFECGAEAGSFRVRAIIPREQPER